MMIRSIDNHDAFNEEERFGVNRRYVAGSREFQNRIEFDCGVFERVRAGSGPFESKFDVYAAVVSETPSFGPLALNSVDISAPDCTQRCFSLFCPGDNISGSFANDVVYEILYINRSVVEDVISAEYGLNQVSLGPCTRVPLTPFLLALWENIRCATGGQSGAERGIGEACAKLLILHLAEPQLLNIAGNTLRRKDRVLGAVFSYIDQNLGNSITLEQIAGSVGISTFHLCRMFRKGTGLSVRQFVMERRLDLARQLLSKTERSISCIAHECGFSSQSHLTTAFRDRFGTTPNAFRNGGTAVPGSTSE